MVPWPLRKITHGETNNIQSKARPVSHSRVNYQMNNGKERVANFSDSKYTTVDNPQQMVGQMEMQQWLKCE